MRNKKVKKRNKNQENKDLSHFFKTLIIRVLFFYLHIFLFLLELEQQSYLPVTAEGEITAITARCKVLHKFYIWLFLFLHSCGMLMIRA